MLKAMGASPGIAIGKVMIKKEEKIEILEELIEDVEEEIKKLDDAVEHSKVILNELYEHTLKNIGEDEAEIFKAHELILYDPELFGKTRELIKEKKICAPYALKTVTQEFLNIFEMMDDEYLRERASDLRDVTTRVIKKLLHMEEVDLSNLDEKVIIVAHDLTTSHTAQIDKSMVKGFATEIGGTTSHSAIMARTLEIPAIVGCSNLLENVKNGDIIVFDGHEGHVYINPDKSILREFERKEIVYRELKEKLSKLKGKESVSKDGVKVELGANIGTPDDLDGVIKNDGEGVGLFRSEFLYMDRDTLPSEEEQFNAYKKVAEGLKDKPIVIRTLDVGGDKEIPYLDLPKEINPFLGYRAIRVCLDKKDIFKTQLRALLRASHYGNIKIMFPMISSIEELRSSKEVVYDSMNELKRENIPYDEEIQLGMMIEIPSAAIISDLLAKEVDFFSIGTNDLIQYTTAVDRMNNQISYLYTPYHPALLRLIKTVIDNGHKENIWVAMCGEVAGNPKLIPILLGMGLDEFSMSPISILKARHIIRNISKKEMEIHVENILKLSSAKDVEEYIDSNININF
ncbi:MAG: phosphoenolpyruvate--protein phosphotransferase [Anaeromicrobium sp.]|uniref:phosphoenolpyruvate--protein phosphotransferase n=1 Tax=Anaeromicrobium sp. TaxID=1929132 RepID=UPI0025CC9F97|nr:phosphoenolpyruvate--protein phosphotransferase [Anaeromicrobium sp.]MCT4593927.1 phosphoenolpyruvate--protein phosphotransferase [Anaeromicrobium sp.]